MKRMCVGLCGGCLLLVTAILGSGCSSDSKEDTKPVKGDPGKIMSPEMQKKYGDTAGKAP